MEDAGIECLILKGIPVHLHYLNKVPSRLLLDVDVLVHHTERQHVRKIMISEGYKEMGRTTSHDTQVNYYNPSLQIPVIFDMHEQAALAFTRLPSLNSLIPHQHKITNYLWENKKKIRVEGTSLPLLNTPAQCLYLIIHCFHHNLRGTHRLGMLNEFLKNHKKCVDKTIELCRLTGVEDMAYIVMSKLSQVYPSSINSLAAECLRPTRTGKYVARYYRKWTSPWQSLNTFASRLELFIVTILLSPLPLSQRLRCIVTFATGKELTARLFSFAGKE
jgi:hypothetical protein